MGRGCDAIDHAPPEEIHPVELTMLAVFIALPIEIVFASLGARNFGHYYLTLLPGGCNHCCLYNMENNPWDSLGGRLTQIPILAYSRVVSAFSCFILVVGQSCHSRIAQHQSVGKHLPYFQQPV